MLLKLAHLTYNASNFNPKQIREKYSLSVVHKNINNPQIKKTFLPNFLPTHSIYIYLADNCIQREFVDQGCDFVPSWINGISETDEEITLYTNLNKQSAEFWSA
ncbi:MAG: hypothetical protein LBQ68_04950, partial [Clostridiales bacterium]|nr:hypothetical protein [Clostridiales bacterium]